eukprot:gene45918-64490_t
MRGDATRPGGAPTLRSRIAAAAAPARGAAAAPPAMGGRGSLSPEQYIDLLQEDEKRKATDGTWRTKREFQERHGDEQGGGNKVEFER